MIIPLQVTFRNMDPSPALEAEVRRRVEQLDRVFGRGLMSCRVAVEAPHRHSKKGTPYHVRVDMTVPGAELVVGRDVAEHAEWADPYIAVRDQFRAARRTLLEHARRAQRQVKVHVPPAFARVARVIYGDGERYGFLETDDGRDVYFHENAVIDGFDNLNVGDRVRYVESMGERGPQASTVALTGRARTADAERLAT
jgi:cold shock CspA family protein/ribosome-associated translation inhibitor RaiA